MLLHLSDVHFGTERPVCLEAIQRFCNRFKPEVIAISGDLTQRARLPQFIACKMYFEQLGIPYFVVPGNHDIPLYHVWDRFFSPFALYQLFFGSLENTLMTEHFYLIGVNTIRRRSHTKGHLSLQQIHEVNEKLIHAPKDKLKIVVSHQPFYTAVKDRHENDCPDLAKLAVQYWGESGLFGLLHGHLHHVAVFDLNQEYQLHLDHPIFEIHAGTATSSRLYRDTPNSFNVLLNDGTIQHYLFDESSKDFVLKV